MTPLMSGAQKTVLSLLLTMMFSGATDFVQSRSVHPVLSLSRRCLLLSNWSYSLGSHSVNTESFKQSEAQRRALCHRLLTREPCLRKRGRSLLQSLYPLMTLGLKTKSNIYMYFSVFFLGSLNKKCQCPTLGFATPKPTIGFLHRSQAHNGYSTVLQAFHATLFYYLSFHV